MSELLVLFVKIVILLVVLNLVFPLERALKIAIGSKELEVSYCCTKRHFSCLATNFTFKCLARASMCVLSRVLLELS